MTFNPDDVLFLRACGVQVPESDVDEAYELDGDSIETPLGGADVKFVNTKQSVRRIYIDETEPNYHNFRERLRETLEGSTHDVLRWELEAPRGGFRFVRVYVKDGPPLTWNQRWEGESI